MPRAARCSIVSLFVDILALPFVKGSRIPYKPTEISRYQYSDSLGHQEPVVCSGLLLASVLADVGNGDPV